MLTMNELLKEERKDRNAGKWFIVNDYVVNDYGEEVHVRIKSFGMFNQILSVGNDFNNYASGHTINTVKDMRAHLRDTINNYDSVLGCKSYTVR